MSHTLLRQRSALLTSLAAGLSLGCSVFGVRSGYEEPPFEVLDVVAGDVEVRRYEARLAFETEVEASDEEAARNEAFRILADYIFGANAPAEQIAMTTPVEVETGSVDIDMTVPVETTARGDRMVMRFFAPSEYTRETLPKPVDPRVKIVEVPGETLATLRFTGLGGQATVEQRSDELSRALDDSAWRSTGDPVALFYDPPWTLPFLRRNEVAAPVEPAS